MAFIAFLIFLMILFGFTVLEIVVALALIVGVIAIAAWNDIEIRPGRTLAIYVALGLLAVTAGRLWMVAIQERDARKPLRTPTGVQVSSLLTPDTLNPPEPLDPSVFDIAPDGSYAFKMGSRIVLVTVSPHGIQPAVLADIPDLDTFAFDAGGALFTLAGGLISIYDPSNEIAQTSSRHPSWFAFEPVLHAQIRTGSRAGSRNPTSGPGGFGSGGGTDGMFRLCCAGTGTAILGAVLNRLAPDDEDVKVTEVAVPSTGRAVGAPPPRIVVDRDQSKKDLPQLLAVPSMHMRLAATDRPGELLLFGGEHPGANRDIHRLQSNGNAEWLASGMRPILLAAEARRQLYFVVTRDGSPESVSFSILHANTATRDQLTVVYGNRTDSNERPVHSPIQSLAVSPTGTMLYFSTDEGVYAISGSIVMKVLDGIGGLLRVRGNTVYLFNAKRRLLLAITGHTA
jgi:hypothetical protein